MEPPFESIQLNLCCFYSGKLIKPISICKNAERYQKNQKNQLSRENPGNTQNLTFFLEDLFF